MAATNFTPISLYYSTTAAAIPSAGNLVAGELALNTVDEKLYFKNSAGTVKLLASNAVTAPVTSITFGSTGLTPATATSGAVTVAGTLANTNGGTGQSSAFTQYGITYASSTTVLATTAAGTTTTVLHGNAAGAPTFGAVSLTADITGTLAPANGGTGIANNAAMTVTGSGNFAYTRTLTGTTNVTFPTTGTLATLAGTETFTNKTITGTKETVFTITDAAAFEINPANGGIQTITLGANRTPAATNFTAGQSVTLMIDDGSAYAITWTTINPTFVGASATGSAPTLATSGYNIIEMWKVGSTIYAAFVGVA